MVRSPVTAQCSILFYRTPIWFFRSVVHLGLMGCPRVPQGVWGGEGDEGGFFTARVDVHSEGIIQHTGFHPIPRKHTYQYIFSSVNITLDNFHNILLKMWPPSLPLAPCTPFPEETLQASGINDRWLSVYSWCV